MQTIPIVSLITLLLLTPAAPSAALTCVVIFRLPEDVTLGSLRWETDYINAPGRILGQGDGARCRSLITDGVNSAFHDHDALLELDSGLVALAGFEGPVNVAECAMAATNVPQKSDFRITVTEASNPEAEPVVPLPKVVITAIDCEAIPSACGNGELDFTEECDDGNGSNSDACTNFCYFAMCGDGFAQFGLEDCDDGNVDNSDGCTNACEHAACGDGFVRSGVEACDDGNQANTDACLVGCQPATCGDGYVRNGVEECDDGGLVEGDGCDSDCTFTACGNGIVTTGEQCDDGNESNTDACLATCQFPTCGDGFVRSGFEECDDGNVANGDGCSQFCEHQQKCGDATDDGKILASDSLRILQRAVGIDVECPRWICDVDGVNGVSASDALRVLRRSVDVPVELTCGEPTTLVIRLTSSVVLGALQIDVGYQSVSGDIDGSGETVECQTEQAGVDSAFNDKPERVLSASFVSLLGIRGPGAVARCAFTPGGNVAPEDFAVSILDAKDRNGSTTPKPGVRVIPD